jgi:hypothetical protein
MDLSDTEKKLAAEQEALAQLQGNPNYAILRDWMQREYERCLKEAFDERKSDVNVKIVIREAKTYKRIMEKVYDAFRKMREGIL